MSLAFTNLKQSVYRMYPNPEMGRECSGIPQTILADIVEYLSW